jgi:uncharacterized membrane protein (DUF373 family)
VSEESGPAAAAPESGTIWHLRQRERESTPRSILPLVLAEDVMHYAVAAVLVVVAAVFLVHAIADALRSNQPFPDAVLSLVEGLLFVIIVLELFRTVVSHFKEGGFQLKPFLIIGVVSGVRHVLTAGARTALDSHFFKIMIELGVNTGIVVGLVVALVLVHRSERPGTGGGIED